MYEVKVQTINKVLTYLANKPFNEVSQLIAELQAGSIQPKVEEEK
tara:strand:- start:1111 stop:1245 length:135 start_codon:yes stop_codon:yes gene_type:complete